MKATRARFVSVLCFVIILPLLVSCSAKVKSIETDPSFTSDRIMDGQVCILGCTSIAVKKPDDMMLSNWLCNDFKDALTEKREGIRVMSWGEVRRAVGEKKMQQCLKEVRDYGSIAPTLLDDLAKELPQDSRYVIAYRIESDRIKFEQDETGENRDGSWVVTGYELKTVRMISTSFSVYDLEQRKRVCLATIEGKSESKRAITKDERVDIGGLLGDVIDTVEVLNDMFGDKDDKPIENFPPPPTQDVVMIHIYNKFAEEIPKNK